MKRRWLALLLCLVMVLTMLSACGKKSDEGSKDTGKTENNQTTDNGSTDGEGGEASDVLTELTLPLSEEKAELSVWTFYANDFVDSPNEVLGVQKMEELTNVHINWQTVLTAEAQEKYGLMVASGDVADIVYFAMATPTQNYPGGIEKGIEDGVFLDATPLIEKYMPNYRGLLEEYPEAKMGVTTDTGLLTLYSFSSNDVELAGENDWAGLVIRQDWLDELNLETPVTLDDWHDVLTAFKNEKGADAPLMIGPSGPNATGSFLTAFGIYPGFYQVNGEVKYGPAQPEYKEYIDLMAQWYKEGLIDPNFTTNNAGLVTPNEYAASDRTGAFTTMYPFAMDNLKNMGMTQDENFYLQAVKNPVKNAGDTPITVKLGDTIVNSMIGISTNCKNPELAAKWIDFQYSMDGMLLNMYGVEGESYTVAADGSYQFTDKVLNDPDGKSASDALKLYARGNGLGRYDWQTGMRTYANYDQIIATEAVWTEQDISMFIPKQTTMTEEEGNEYNSLYTAVNTLMQESSTNWIQGNASTDNFDQYVENLNQYGLTRCLEIQQAALDRYYNRAK